jgi:hypothetical protein
MRPIVYYLDYGGDPVTVPCKPVGLTDITADGIPELIFMEVATEERGDLWIYSSDGANARCILYVPGITRIGYDDAAMTFDEYQDKQKQYEEDQNALLDALKTYTDTMNEFNRTACGGVYPYLTGKSVRLSASGTGLSYSEDSDKAMYYFNPIIQSQEFEVSVFIPENFPIELSTYELWVDTTKIGETTDIDKSIRHLSLVTGNYQKVLLRFFAGNGNFVDDCEINPSVAKGPLDIVTERKAGEDEVKIGTFTSETNSDTEITTITLTLDDGRDEKKYRILTEDGAFVSSDEKLEISKPFKYLSLITKDFRRLKIEFFDENDNLRSEGRFDDSALEKKIMEVNKQ